MISLWAAKSMTTTIIIEGVTHVKFISILVVDYFMKFNDIWVIQFFHDRYFFHNIW